MSIVNILHARGPIREAPRVLKTNYLLNLNDFLITRLMVSDFEETLDMARLDLKLCVRGYPL